MAADFNPTTVFELIALGVTLGFTAKIDQTLVRFGIATGHNDPNLAPALSAADPAVVDFFGLQLMTACYNHP